MLPLVAVCLFGAQAFVPEPQRAQAQRVLYGLNQGAPVSRAPLPPSVVAAAEAHRFDLAGCFRFAAAPEQLRPPRVVRVGLVQNAIQRPTTAPFGEQAQVALLPPGRCGQRAGWGLSLGQDALSGTT
jgi:hypothetical protein